MITIRTQRTIQLFYHFEMNSLLFILQRVVSLMSLFFSSVSIQFIEYTNFRITEKRNVETVKTVFFPALNDNSQSLFWLQYSNIIYQKFKWIQWIQFSKFGDTKMRAHNNWINISVCLVIWMVWLIKSILVGYILIGILNIFDVVFG